MCVFIPSTVRLGTLLMEVPGNLALRFFFFLLHISFVFCSSDLYEILCDGQFISCELNYQISWRSVHKCACMSCKCAPIRFIASARVYESCERICSRIFMKFKNLVHKIVIDQHIKFHKDRSFCFGDFCKTILTVWKH